MVFCSGHNLESKYFVFVASTEYYLFLGVEEFSFYSHIGDKAAEENIHIPIAIGMISVEFETKQQAFRKQKFRSGIEAH